MFQYQMIQIRNAELMAEAANGRLIREFKRANKAREAGESGRTNRERGVRRALLLAHR